MRKRAQIRVREHHLRRVLHVEHLPYHLRDAPRLPLRPETEVVGIAVLLLLAGGVGATGGGDERRVRVEAEGDDAHERAADGVEVETRGFVDW